MIKTKTKNKYPENYLGDSWSKFSYICISLHFQLAKLDMDIGDLPRNERNMIHIHTLKQKSCQSDDFGVVKPVPKVSMHTRQKLVTIGVMIPFYGIVKVKVRHRDDILVIILSV